MSETRDHVVRPLPPWRDPKSALTECGREVSDVASVVSVDAMMAKVRREGQARAAYSTCMTCWQTANRHTGGVQRASREPGDVSIPDQWWRDPAAVIGRDGHGGWGGKTPQPITDELRALGMLFEAHREEFADLLAAVTEGDQLAARRTKPKRVISRDRPL